MGDFWGIQSAHPEVDYEGGVSTVLCNTPKGVSAIDTVKEKLEWGESSIGKVLPGNPSLVRSVSPYRKRNEFMLDLANGLCIAELMSKYDFEPTFRQRLLGIFGAVKSKIAKIVRRRP